MAVTHRLSSPRFLVLALFYVAGLPSALPGQTTQTELSNATQEHIASAHAAQQRNDYLTAEREYRAVLAVMPNFAEVHMNLGLLYQLQDRISEAMKEFQRALTLKPGLAGANFFLGVDHCKLGQASKAIPYLSAAVKAEPNRVEIWSWLVTAQEMLGRYRAEVVTLKRALDLHPKDGDLLYLLGRAYEQLGKGEVARLQQSAPNSAWSEQLVAESYATSSQWPSAVLHFQNALAASPNLSGLHVALGEVLLRAGKPKLAAEQFEAELQLQPRQLRAIVRRGEARLITGDVEGALADWREALAIDKAQAERVLGMRESGFGDAALEQLPESTPEKLDQLSSELRSRNSPAAQFAVAFVRAQKGITLDISADLSQKDEASDSHTPPRCSESELRQQIEWGRVSGISHCAATMAPRLPVKFRMEVVRAMIEAGDYEASLKALNTVLPVEQRSPEASYWRARCYEKLATAAYLRLYRSDPNSYRLHQLMGDLEAAREDDGKAIDEYRAAIAMKPSLPNLHYSLGHLLWKNLKVPEARAEFEAELAINPRHPGALHDLGNTYLLEHQPEQARTYLLRALAADPGNRDIHRDLGTAYSQLREYAKAETEYKVALSGDHDGSVHYQLARLYQTFGRKEEAAREFALSTELNRQSHDKLEKQTQRLAEIEGLQ